MTHIQKPFVRAEKKQDEPKFKVTNRKERRKQEALNRNRGGSK